MEKEIFLCGLRDFAGKKEDKRYYVVDYVRTDKGIPKSDFITALEYTEIKKKVNGKYYQKYTGIFNINEFDKMYLSAIK